MNYVIFIFSNGRMKKRDKNNETHIYRKGRLMSDVIVSLKLTNMCNPLKFDLTL